MSKNPFEGLDRNNPADVLKAAEMAGITRYELRKMSPMMNDYLDGNNGQSNEQEEQPGVISDLWSSFGVGAGNLVSAAGSLYGLATGDMDNGATRLGEQVSDYWNKEKSNVLTELEQGRRDAINSSDSEFGKFSNAIWETVSNPRLLASFVSEQIPMFAVPGGAGAAGAKAGTAYAAKKGTELAAKKFGSKVGVAAGVGTGAAMQGGDVGANTYEELIKLPEPVWEQNPEYLQLKDELGNAEAAKEQIALSYGRKASAIAGTLSIGSQFIPGGATIEKAMAGNKFTGGLMGRAAKGFAGEGAQEIIEEGGGKVISNSFIDNIDENQGLFEGVGESSGLGLLGGGVMGGTMAAISGAPNIESTKQQYEAKLNQLRESGKKAVAEGDTAAAQQIDSDFKQTQAAYTEFLKEYDPGFVSTNLNKQQQAKADKAAQGGDALDQELAAAQAASTIADDVAKDSQVKMEAQQGLMGGMNVWQPNFTMPGSEPEQVQQVDGEYIANTDYPTSVPLGNNLGFDESVGAIDAMPENRINQSDTIFTGQQREELSAPQRLGLPDKYTNTIQAQDRTAELDAQEQMRQVQNAPRQIEQKDVIFAEDNRYRVGTERATVRSNGNPFPTVKSVQASRSYRQAIEDGLNPEIVKVGNGFGWETQEDVDRGELFEAEAVTEQVEETQPITEAPTTEQPQPRSLLDTGRTSTQPRPTKAVTPQGREVGVQYRVVDASEVINSNDENGTANPDFPQEYQNRNRSRSASTQQIRNIANKLNPEQVDYGNMSTDGAPIVSPDGIVESGNGRVAGIKLAYKQRNAENYRNYLEQQGYDVEGLKEPILVRVRTTDMTPEERRQFVTESNERTTLSLSATEKAKDDANIISRIATDFMGGDVDNVANAGFVRKFMQGISSTEAAELTDAQGRLSQTGKRRIEAALLFNAYGDERVVTDLFESSDNDIKSIGGAMLDNAGQWAKMRQQAPTELDLTNNVVEAVNLVKQARREGRSVQELVGQQDIFSGEIPSQTERALKMMYGPELKRAVSRKALSEKLAQYATLASNVNPEPGLFGEEVDGVTSNDLMDQINGTESTTQDNQSDLFNVEDNIGGRSQGESPSGNDTLTKDNQSLREPEPQEVATQEPPESGFFTPDESKQEAPIQPVYEYRKPINNDMVKANGEPYPTKASAKAAMKSKFKNSDAKQSAYEVVAVDGEDGSTKYAIRHEESTKINGNDLVAWTSKETGRSHYTVYTYPKDGRITDTSKFFKDKYEAIEYAENWRDDSGADAGQFSLESETESQRSAREEAQRQEAERQATVRREQEQRVQADRELNDFTLSGSNAPADIAASRGQGDLLAQSNSSSEDDSPMFRMGDNKPSFLFAGERSKTANTETLEQAKQMDKGNRPSGVIWRDTGWFKDVDGKWKSEIDDSQAVLDDGHVGYLRDVLDGETGYAMAEEVLEHEGLFNAYPQARYIPIEVKQARDMDGASGFYSPSKDYIALSENLINDKEALKSVLLHEIQHWIQERENFAKGGSSDERWTESVKEAVKTAASRKRIDADVFKEVRNGEIQDAEKAAEKAKYAMLFKDMKKLIEYAHHPSPTGIKRHIANIGQWLYHKPFVNERGGLTREAHDIDLNWYNLPKRHKKQERARFLRDQAMDMANLFRDVIPTDYFTEFENDTRQLNSLVNAMAREADKKGKVIREAMNRERGAARAERYAKNIDRLYGFGIYKALAGEVEARNVQARIDMTAEERANKQPSLTADVRPEEQIVTDDYGRSISSPELSASYSNIPTARNRSSVSPADANKVIDSIISSWTGGIKARRNEFVVASTYNDLPSDIKDAAKKQGAENKVYGVFHNGKTYVVLDKHNSTQELETTIFHETYGHHGMRTLFGKELTQKMNQLFAANGGMSGLKAKAEKHNIDLSLYIKGTEQAGMSQEVRNRVLMEELLAHMQQDNKPSVKRMAKEVVGYIRQKLRDLGFAKLANVSDSDLFYILKQSRDAVVKGSVNGGGIRFMFGGKNAKPANYFSNFRPSHNDLRYQRAKSILKSNEEGLDIEFINDQFGAYIDINENTFIKNDFGIEENIGEVSVQIAFIDGVLYEMDPSAYFYKDEDPYWSPVVSAPSQSVAKLYKKLDGKSYPIMAADGSNQSEFNKLIKLKSEKGFVYNDGVFELAESNPENSNGGDTMFMIGNVSKEQLMAEGLNDPREIAYQESILETLKSSDNAFDIRKAEALERKLNLAKAAFANEDQNNIASDDVPKSFTLKPDGIIKDTGDYYSVSIKDNNSGVESKYRLNKNPDDGYYVAEEQENGEWSYYNEYESLQEFADSIDDINEYLGQDRKNENFSGSASGTPLFRTMDDSAPQSFSAPVEKKWSKDWFKRQLQDKFAPIKDMQASIEGVTGQALPEDQDTYRAEELFYGKTENDLNKMEDNHVKPLVDAMTQNNIEAGELDQYLMAKHAKERNKHIASINPEMPDGGSGMTNKEAAEILSRYEQEGKLAGLSIAANEVYKITKKRRQLLRESGLEDEALLDVWDAGYQFYVPLKGFANDSEGNTIAKTGKGFDIRGKESMKAMGRRTMAESPTAHAIQDLSATIIRARKNEVAQTFLNMVESNPNPEIWEVFTDENPDTFRHNIDGEVRSRATHPEDGRLKNQDLMKMRGEKKDDYFAVKVDGKTKYIKLKDKDGLLMEAMKNMGPAQVNGFTKAMGAATRWLSMVNTSLNPEFTITNFTRDIQTALFNALAEQDLTDGKVKDKQIAGSMVKGTGKAVRALYKFGNQSLSDEARMYDKPYKEWIEEFLEDGAKTGYFDSKDVDQIGKDMSSLLDMTKGTNKGKLLKAKKTVGDFVENINGSIENGVRLSAYIEARRAGVTRNKAASFAKNLSVNFNRKGSAGTFLNSVYMFFNAAVQGNVNFARAILTPKVDEATGKKSLNKAQKIAAGIVGASFGWASLMREIGGEDEDGVPYWDKIPKGVRERSFVILKPGTDGEYFKIPLPYGYNIFYNIGDAMEAAVQSDTRTKGDLAAELALSAYASFIPLGSPVGDNEAESAALVATPTLFKPIVEIATNKNFFGGQIYRENMPYGPELRDSQMSMRSTGEMYKGIARWMNDVMGDGMKYKVDGEAPLYDISPDTIEHIVEFGLGGLYRFGSRMADTVGTVANGGDLDVTSTPFIRQVNGEIRPYEDISNFYDARQELKNIEAELKSRKGKARMEFMQEYRDKYRLRGLMSSIDKRMKLLRKQRDRIEIDDSLSFVEREEKLQRIEDKMKSAVATFNEKWNETE